MPADTTSNKTEAANTMAMHLDVIGKSSANFYLKVSKHSGNRCRWFNLLTNVGEAGRA
jgi:hypothetical protein